MGIVYRAEDALLRRAVALKFIPEARGRGDDAGYRWLREAQTAASLAHPSICTIYEAGEVAAGTIDFAGIDPLSDMDAAPSVVGLPYLTMELIEGAPLSDLLREKGPLPFDEVLDIAVQIADGLVAAHARGVVHRDLKPGNVMITPERRVKILDFGLARLLDPQPVSPAEFAPIQTASHELGLDGRVLGTIAYLSPERALGKRGESQSDVFSFGVMLYEMVSGVRPFQGETTTAVLAKILESEPVALAQLRPDLPPGLARIIQRCLRKRSEERYNDTRDLAAELRVVQERAAIGARTARGAAPTEGETTIWVAPPPPRVDAHRDRPGRPLTGRRTRTRLILLFLGLAAIAAGGVFLPRLKGPSKAPPPPRFQRVTQSSDARYPAISPDGNFIAYVQLNQDKPDAVIVRDLRSAATIEVFKGGQVGRDLAFSPDGSELLFSRFSVTGGECRVLLVPMLGGTPKMLGSGLVSPVCWSPDGRRVAGWMGGNRLLIVDRASGASDTLRSGIEFAWLYGLAWSPRAPLLLLHVRDPDGEGRVFIQSVDGRHQIPLDQLTGTFATPQWAPGGDAIYAAGLGESETLWKLPVDVKTGAPAGRLISFSYPIRDRFGVSGDGRSLVYEQSAEKRSVTRVDISADPGRAAAITRREISAGFPRMSSPRCSHNGDRLAWIRVDRTADRPEYSLVVSDLDGRSEQILDTQGQSLLHPSWSPDGRKIAYRSGVGGTWRVATADLTTGEIRIFETPRMGSIVEWAAEDRIVVQRSDNRNYTLLNSISGEEKPVLARDLLGVWQARPSPDGRWLAFAHTEDAESGMSVGIVSLEDGSERHLYAGRAAPVGWSADGRRVFLVRESAAALARGEQQEEIIACPVDGGPVEILCSLPGGCAWSEVDVSSDGLHVFYVSVLQTADIWIAKDFDSASR